MPWTGSDFEIDKLGFKFAGEETYENVSCIGSMEEEMAVRSVTKSCRGVIVKKRSNGTGEGTLKVTAHLPWTVFTKAYGMNLTTLVEGVKAYGRNSIHPTFSVVAHVIDEDNNEKLKAYPNCVINTGVVRKIENGAEEVAEMELEIGVMPDDYNNGLYEVVVDELKDETIKNTWMTAFTPELVQIKEA